MKDIDYGYVRLKLMDIMQEQNISINKLACRAEMQRTQLKAYMKNEVQRVDLAILARLCYVPSLPLADAKWSLLRLHFFSICAICSVFMRSLEF